jgi:acyl-CoA synthetase (AMP-forming)/AMP-acid ligase II
MCIRDRYITNTAQALPAWISRGLREAVPHLQIFAMYGLTECKRTTYLEPELIGLKPESVGKAIPGTEVFLVGEDGRRIDRPGEVGELVVRGPHIMVGYLNDPEMTARIIREYEGERTLFSGDLFHLDPDGDLYFHGRRDDLLKVGGEKVYPLEVERAICSLLPVSESAVVGIPDELIGTSLVAFVVPAEGSVIDRDLARRTIRGAIEWYKVPQRIVPVEGLPRNPNGKVDKKALIGMAKSSLGGSC